MDKNNKAPSHILDIKIVPPPTPAADPAPPKPIFSISVGIPEDGDFRDMPYQVPETNKRPPEYTMGGADFGSKEDEEDAPPSKRVRKAAVRNKDGKVALPEVHVCDNCHKKQAVAWEGCADCLIKEGLVKCTECGTWRRTEDMKYCGGCDHGYICVMCNDDVWNKVCTCKCCKKELCIPCWRDEIPKEGRTHDELCQIAADYPPICNKENLCAPCRPVTATTQSKSV
jgi:hypothetical protein